MDALVVVMVDHVTWWAGCILPPLSSHSCTREPCQEEEEDEEVFSVPVSLH